jgi:hypothetical protein
MLDLNSVVVCNVQVGSIEVVTLLLWIWDIGSPIHGHPAVLTLLKKELVADAYLPRHAVFAPKSSETFLGSQFSFTPGASSGHTFCSERTDERPWHAGFDSAMQAVNRLLILFP